MNSNDLKGIAEGLIDEFNYAAKELSLIHI